MPLITTKATSKVLLISAPSMDLKPGTSYKAKIVSDTITFTESFKTKSDKEFQIAQVKVAINGFPSFNAAILSIDHETFASKHDIDSEVDVFIKVNEKSGYNVASL